MLLAIDTSTPRASVALADLQGNVQRELVAEPGVGHGAQLTPLIVQLLEVAQCEWSQLAAVAVAIGPGAFTGIRVGLATAKGIAQARNLPLIGIPTLLALAEPVFSSTPHPAPCTHVVAILDARRGEAYWCVLSRNDWARWSACVDVTEWKKLCQVGSIAECLATVRALPQQGAECQWVGDVHLSDLQIASVTTPWTLTSATPTAAAVARLAAPRLHRHQIDDCLALVPLYVRASYAG